MDHEIKTLLEQLLVDRVLKRGRDLRSRWLADEKEKTGAIPPAEQWPVPAFFIDQAVAEIKEFREPIISKLTPPLH